MANDDTRPEKPESEVKPSVPASEARSDAPVTDPDTTVAATADAEEGGVKADRVTPEADRPDEPPTLTKAPEPAAAAPAPAPARRRAIFVPLVAGGLIAAALGFALAKWTPEGWPMQDNAPLQAEIQRQAQEITALRDRVASLSAPNITPLEQRVTALEEGRVDPEAIRAEIDELRQKINDDGIPADLQATIDDTRQQLDAARQQAAELQRQAEDSARATTVAAAQNRIAAALDSGTPFGAALQNLTDAGVDVPQGLADNAGGVPALTSLQQSFPDAARAALEASLRADSGATWGERTRAFLRSQTGARSLAPREGDDPDAILSRAEAALGNGDIAGALDEIRALPLEGQAAMSDWRAEAGRRLAAVEAMTSLEDR
ncbi:COG4223 family protein [Falsirhodobacter algicola]|uniref:Mitochondrial inner membrane protein n=1 Tax=Falsirhodobacter algicola TaxID=2692330 RepID=A0A8J8MTJ6_9RHOB|nr:hypothetical protein [Falsirhodobacter algicola]QUS36452.1 hypothetical protein GR316_09365 [Falsirhodobacter algicola]